MKPGNSPMSWWSFLALWPVLKVFAPAELRPLLAAIEAGQTALAESCARQIAERRARGLASGQAAKASSEATSKRMRGRR